MNIEQIKAEVSQLPLSDQLALMESIWASISSESEVDFPVPLWQKQFLKERYQAYQQGQETQDWSDVHQSLLAK